MNCASLGHSKIGASRAALKRLTTIKKKYFIYCLTLTAVYKQTFLLIKTKGFFEN
jgi:hypothetical protein